MRKATMLLFVILLFIQPVAAMEFTAPNAPPEAEKYMPDDTESFWDGFFEILKEAITEIKPGIAEAAGVCLSLLLVVLIVSIFKHIGKQYVPTINLVAGIAVGTVLLKPSSILIQSGIETVQAISEYGKMLLPVMTAAMAAQGSSATSAALYTGTTVFNTVLNAAMSKVLIPMIYIYIVFSISSCAIGQDLLKKLADFIKWLITWSLKIVLYLFTGYIGITGVINGVTDAAALKATKLAISGFVPIVGNVLSDASDTVLLSAAIMKNAAGIYGLLTITAICIGPFMNIGIQYVLLKFTSGLCSIFDAKEPADLIQGFSTGMGFLLAMTGIMSLIFLVSIVCFMRGIGNG